MPLGGYLGSQLHPAPRHPIHPPPHPRPHPPHRQEPHRRLLRLRLLHRHPLRPLHPLPRHRHLRPIHRLRRHQRRPQRPPRRHHHLPRRRRPGPLRLHPRPLRPGGDAVPEGLRTGLHPAAARLCAPAGLLCELQRAHAGPGCRLVGPGLRGGRWAEGRGPV
ncbi:hypothetical protein Tdes44962_MAKER09862 [Teratosphaeria destructans]|uniref:Uncharacterized protein n=1 Tax=Teratosphaeria destructans TaxID=418781 RepID=A0A9W7SR57_9PEZI|nr:hypothetical protein Tdes44962_MAKER09862 [Teratosphaeria destructans]